MRAVAIALFGVAATLVPALLTSPGGAVPHPRIPGMRVGGGEMNAWAVVHGLSIIALFGTLIVSGVRPRRRRSHGLRLFARTSLVAGAFVAIFWLSDAGLVGGLPLATAWALLVFAFTPVWFVVLFCRRYDDLVLDPEEYRHFREALARRREDAS